MSARVRRAGDERCEVPPARDDVRCVAAMRRDFARSRRAFDFPARVARDDSRVGVGVRLRPWAELPRVLEAPAARLRVATPFACMAARARRGFARVCSMLRLVMRPVRRALRLGERRGFGVPREEVERFDVDFPGIALPSFGMKESTNLQ